MVFDDLKSTVTWQEKSTSLQPLSYKLLKALAEQPNHFVSQEAILKEVWGDVVVGAEAIKQRVFLLRKSLTAAGIEIEIEGSRGMGYRVILEEQNHQRPVLRKYQKHLMIVTSLIIVVISIMLIRNEFYSIPKNNRVVLWTVALEGQPAKQIHEQWKSILLQANASNDIQLLESYKINQKAIYRQARDERIALISQLEAIELQSGPAIRLQIIEPRASTILRSDTLFLDDKEKQNDVLASQLKGIQQLLNSGELILTKKQRDNASDEVWNRLRDLASGQG